MVKNVLNGKYQKLTVLFHFCLILAFTLKKLNFCSSITRFFNLDYSTDIRF